jgi:hypothetical protein
MIDDDSAAIGAELAAQIAAGNLHVRRARISEYALLRILSTKLHGHDPAIGSQTAPAGPPVSVCGGGGSNGGMDTDAARDAPARPRRNAPRRSG